MKQQCRPAKKRGMRRATDVNAAERRLTAAGGKGAAHGK